jgi:hypothetical protein
MSNTLECALEHYTAAWGDIELATRDFVVFRSADTGFPDQLHIVPRINTIEYLTKCFRYAAELGVINIDAENSITAYSVLLTVGVDGAYPSVLLTFIRK